MLQGVLSASMQLNVANDQLSSDSRAKSLIERVLQLMGHVVEDGRKGFAVCDSQRKGPRTLIKPFPGFHRNSQSKR